MPSIIRSKEEIDEQLSSIYQCIDKGASHYQGMTYEEGALAMYDWLIGVVDDLPIEEEV